MHAARHTLTITTPYDVPNESMQDALCAAARRDASTPGDLPGQFQNRYCRDGGAMVNGSSALEQQHRHARANTLNPWFSIVFLILTS